MYPPQDPFRKADKVCIIVPTFNNANTLEFLIRDLLSLNLPVIVVNDVSTDDTIRILEQYPEIDRVSYQKNSGKVLH